MNVNFVTSLIWQKHKSWGEIIINAKSSVWQAVVFQTGFMALFGGSLVGGLVTTVTNAAIGAIWSVGIVDTAVGLMNSVVELKTAASRLGWVVKSIPSNPKAALASGQAHGSAREMETLDLQNWDTITQYIQNRGLKKSLRNVWGTLSTDTIQNFFEYGFTAQNMCELGTALPWATNNDCVEILAALHKAGSSTNIYISQRKALELQRGTYVAQVQAAPDNVAGQVIKTGVNLKTLSMTVGSIIEIGTAAFTVIGIIFNLTQRAYTREEFAAAQFQGAKWEDVAGFCATAQVVQTASKVGSLMNFTARNLPLVGVLLQMGRDFHHTKGKNLISRGFNFVTQKLPFHAFLIGWYGMAPAFGNWGQYMMMVPLIAKCAYHTFNPDNSAPSSQEVLSSPEADPKDAQGIISKFVFGHWFPHMGWEYKAARLNQGYRHFSSIHHFWQGLSNQDPLSKVGQAAFKCAVFDQLPILKTKTA